MRKELKPVADAMAGILGDGRSTRIERILAAQIVMSLHGRLLPAISEEWLDKKSLIELRRIQRDVVQKVLQKKEVRRRQNRRAFLRRKLRALEEGSHE